MKKQTDVTEFEIGIFENEKLKTTFKVSLQPSGFDNVLPTYKLISHNQTLPQGIIENMEIISDWIKEGNKIC